MDNTGVQLLLLNHQCDLCGFNYCVLSGWWIGGIFPTLPVCPYGRRLCIYCVNEPVSFHPTQCWPRCADRRLLLHTIYTAMTDCLHFIDSIHTKLTHSVYCLYFFIQKHSFSSHIQPEIAHRPSILHSPEYCVVVLCSKAESCRSQLGLKIGSAPDSNSRSHQRLFI